MKILKLEINSPFYRAGLRKGDEIHSINGVMVENDLELSFAASCEEMDVLFSRQSTDHELVVIRESGEYLGVIVDSPPIRRCANKCLFCFIDQMPKGLRKGLYVKDEDYRLSFLEGNYVTLTSLTEKYRTKIITLGLSPLYISVHATDFKIRKMLLGNSHADMVMTQLTDLASNGIQFHTQLVICPKINDGAILKCTINDLLSLGDSLLSVAIVPVGLTKFRANKILPVLKDDATVIIRDVSLLSDRDTKKNGWRRIFISDEFFIKAGLDVPKKGYYGDYPQIENGIGLIRQFLDSWESTTLKQKKELTHILSKQPCSVITSQSAVSCWKTINQTLENISAEDNLRIIPVDNRFFGTMVTVAGLLTARDVIHAIKKHVPAKEIVALPKVMFNHNDITLDGYSKKRIEKICGHKLIISKTASDLAKQIKELQI